MSLQWNDSLASGSADIDSQHKELFTRVNALLSAFSKGSVAREDISKIVQYLTEYVIFHFGTEEKYMTKYNYSSISAHKSQHEQFVKAFLKLKDRLLMEGINEPLAADTKDLVVDWLVNHIKYSDRALGMYLKHKM
ncbi:MAG TPA: bacteriohemerythrin [Dissulfurispiraceae bacterium]|nr:bacteriohemerythrin [Dissulfurispiraceae bacterium]